MPLCDLHKQTRPKAKKMTISIVILNACHEYPQNQMKQFTARKSLGLHLPKQSLAVSGMLAS